ncbi:MAG TPA: sulfocyanin-like copper-binding protein, partial [Gemmatimonadales bacterium]
RHELRKVHTTVFRDQTTTMIKLPRSLHITVTAAVLSTVVACSGRSQVAASDPAPAESPPAAASAPVTAADTAASPPWMVVDSAARAVTLSLEVTAPPGAPSALINGHRAGEARVVVPLGWTVKWDWLSADSTAPHSLVVMVQREKIPLEGGRASLSNAMTRMVVEGLRPGQNDQTTFVADEAGWYWMLCGVPGHAIKGEWLELRVDPEAKLPSVVVKKKA